MTKHETQELIREIVKASSIQINTERDWTGAPLRVSIALAGPAAAIPSLKNAKMPNQNFLNPKVIARLVALDVMFERAVKESGAKLCFPAGPVWVTLLLGRRAVAFDADNCLAAIMDWLEPNTKSNRGNLRGWGVGLVTNDRYSSGLAVKASDLGLTTESTLIIVSRLEMVRKDLFTFIETQGACALWA